MPKQESELKIHLRRALCDQARAIRDRRRVVEERWLRTRRTWTGHALARYRPSDSETIDFHIPSGRRAIERAVTRGVSLLTPKVKWFEVLPAGNTEIDNRRLSNVDNFMWYIIRKKIKTRSIISQLVRSLILYGVPILKTSLSIEKSLVYPTQRAVDPFSFYIYPETAPTVNEAEIVFEDFLFSYSRYQTFVDKGIVDSITPSDLTKPDWPYHLVERLAYQGITDPTSNVDTVIDAIGNQLQRTTSAFVSLTEEWLRREGKLYQVYIAWNLKNGPRIVGFFESVYDDPLFRMAIHRPLPGETYTPSQAEDIIELDNVQGDLFKQFINSVNREQGFVAFGGGGNARRETFQFKGGAKWDFGTDIPREVMQFVSPPVTSTNQLRAWQITNGMLQSMGGAGTITEGQPGRNMPRAGGAVESLINLGMADIKDFAEIIEQEVLTPGLHDVFQVMQLIPEDQVMRIPGSQAIYGDRQLNIIHKRDISGAPDDFEFEWIGSLQFQDETQRAQRLMVFLNLLPQLMPMLQSQGYTINLSELIQTIWHTGIGERSLAKVVVTTAEIQQKQREMATAMGIPPEMQQQVEQLQQQGAGQGEQQPPQSVPGLTPETPRVPEPRSTTGFGA